MTSQLYIFRTNALQITTLHNNEQLALQSNDHIIKNNSIQSRMFIGISKKIGFKEIRTHTSQSMDPLCSLMGLNKKKIKTNRIQSGV